jgi:hypothetical protein
MEGRPGKALTELPEECRKLYKERNSTRELAGVVGDGAGGWGGRGLIENLGWKKGGFEVLLCIVSMFSLREISCTDLFRLPF